MSKFIAIAALIAVAVSLSIVEPAEALECTATNTHGEGFHPNKTTALGNAVKAWSIRAKSFGLAWSQWANASHKVVTCQPATGGLIRCRIMARPCYYQPDF